MNYTNNSHKWSISIFCTLIYPHSPRAIFQLDNKSKKSLSFWSTNSISSYGNCIPRVCTTMRTNIVLRSNCDYGSPIGHPNSRNRPSNMNLRRTLSITTNTKPFLLITLPPTNSNYCYGNSTFDLASRKGVFKSIQYPYQSR